MASAVWMILYDLDAARADEYLQWFDEVHIPEKLARPGYSWAAHYRALAADGTSAPTCIAMFGGTDSRVFYDPSPAQIKPRQTPETRAMMACRSNSRMMILAEEWIDGDPDKLAPAVDADRIELALFDANDNDEQLGAWLAQDYLPAAVNSGRTRKWLASTGPVRHVLLHECSADGSAALMPRPWNDWTQQVSGYLSYPVGEPMLADRIWPPGD